MKDDTHKDGYMVFNIDNASDFEQIYLICNALGDRKRLSILKKLQDAPYKFSVRELADEFGMPMSTIIHHLDILDEAKLIRMQYRNDNKKERKTIHSGTWNYAFIINKQVQTISTDQHTYSQIMPVGDYVDFVGEKFYFVGDEKQFSAPFSPERFGAKLVFTPNGIIEYYFDNKAIKKKKLVGLSFSLEICSEFPFYDNNHKSDITFWINNIEVAKYRCEGDYGDRRGLLNPDWWLNINTQYGKLVNVTVNEKGVFINGALTNRKITLNDLNLTEGQKISLKFGNAVAAEYPGGFNLFGKDFGDYPQDIIFQIHYHS